MDARRLPGGDAFVQLAPDGRSFLLAWFGSPCETLPTIILFHEAEVLGIGIFQGRSTRPVCTDLGVPRAVRLALDRPWSPDKIGVTVESGDPPAASTP